MLTYSKSIILTIIILFAMPSLVSAWEGKVVSVTDGDTIKVLKAGLAWHHRYYSRDPELAKLEFEARSKKVGLWKEPDQIAPWKWRKNKRNKSG